MFQTFGKQKHRSKVTRTVWVQAKPGYAVGGLTGRAGLLLNGMALTFLRIDGAKLNPDACPEKAENAVRHGACEAASRETTQRPQSGMKTGKVDPFAITPAECN